MKRIITCAVLCAALSALLTLTGCGHGHTAEKWTVDADAHWRECAECSEKYDEAEHSFEAFEVCSGCGSSVIREEDGSASVFSYDSNGSLIYNAGFDADGSLIYYYRYELEYYEDSNIKLVKEYVCDVLSGSGKEYLCQETGYIHCEAPNEQTVFAGYDAFCNEDGSRTVYKYDEHLGVREAIEYDCGGKVLHYQFYSYVLDSNGDVVKEKLFEDDVLYREIYYGEDEFGNSFPAKYIYYEKDGSVSREVRYDAEGNEIE